MPVLNPEKSRAIDDFRSGDTNYFYVCAKSNGGIDISGESPKTRASPTFMKEREIMVANHAVSCELHAKYSPTNGRIHFHIGQNLNADILKETEGKVIVGIFCAHLSV